MRISSVTSLFKKVRPSIGVLKSEPIKQTPMEESYDRLAKLLKALEQIDVNKFRSKKVRGQ